MPVYKIKDLVDMRWTDSGDFMLDPLDNDLKDTKHELMQAAIQHLECRLQSSPGDWKFSPSTGAGLETFAGRLNNPSLGLDIEDRIMNELTRSGLFLPNELTVQAFPLDKHSVGVYLRVTPSAQTESMQIVISYSLQDNKVSLRN